MGFSLWITGDIAWAQGTCESRPAGAAVIAATDLFKRRDFHPLVTAPSVFDPGYVGLFVSLGDLNAALRARAGSKMLLLRARQGRRHSFLYH